MSTGNLTGKLVSRDFWPSCATCTFFAACATRPHHLAYPHTWHWGREFVSFPDGDLILTSWAGNTVIGQRHTGCTQYTVAPEYVSNPHPHHQRYLALEHERTALEKTLARLERNGTFTSETESLIPTALWPLPGHYQRATDTAPGYRRRRLCRRVNIRTFTPQRLARCGHPKGNMTMPFTRAIKLEAKLRLALAAPSGAGKTYAALLLATHLGGPIAVIDTERGSASKYADLFPFDGIELDSFHPQRYIDAMHEAEEGGYGILIIDSLSHAWAGKDGALELVDKAAKRFATHSRSGREDAFAAWREVTPIHNALVDAMVQSRLHLIATLHTKTEYVLETKDGKTAPCKIGLAPIQREGLEYEYDVAADLDQEHTLIVHKRRCSA